VTARYLRLISLDRASYLQVTDALRPLGRQLNLAVAGYAEVMKLLPPGVSLREAVTDFVHRNNTVRETRTVPQLVSGSGVRLVVSGGASQAFVTRHTKASAGAALSHQARLLTA
jgi:hypothetical protein